MLVRHVYRQHAIRLQMPEVQNKRFPREQMHRDGVARKCVHRQHVEVLGRLSFQREPRVPQRHVQAGLADLQKSELRFGQLQHQRIDFVEPEIVARAAISGQRARPQPDHAHAHPAAFLILPYGAAHAGVRSVVSGGPSLQLWVQVLLAVRDRSVHQGADRFVAIVGSVVHDFQAAIEVPYHQARIAAALVDDESRIGRHSQSQKRAGQRNGPLPGASQAALRIRAQHRQHHTRAGRQTHRQFVESGKHARRDQRHENSPQRAAQRDRYVKGS